MQDGNFMDYKNDLFARELTNSFFMNKMKTDSCKSFYRDQWESDFYHTLLNHTRYIRDTCTDVKRILSIILFILCNIGTKN